MTRFIQLSEKGFSGMFDFGLPVWLIIIFWLSIPFTLYILLANVSYLLMKRSKRARGLIPDGDEVVVAVLGDLGHSPRTLNQARQFAKLGYHVYLAGYLESDLPTSFYDNDDITVEALKVIRNDSNLPYLIFAGYKVIAQFYTLWKSFSELIDDKTKYVMLQNPPCIPALAVLCLLKFTHYPHIKLIIDWHNLNYTILNLKFKNLNHPLVRFLKYYEKILSRKFVDYNLTVTEKMAKFLIEDFGLNKKKVMTLYDKPSDNFVSLKSQSEADHIMGEIPELFNISPKYEPKKDHIVVVSSSFTEDEDFTILVDALIKLESKMLASNVGSKVFVFVTGKGPLKGNFIKMVNSHDWSKKKVIIKTAWLPIRLYPELLKLADIGVSLHYSSSGLDLPMKIVDLFGCGIPALSLNFGCIDELVKHGVNGLVMKDNKNADEMCDKIYNLFYEDPNLLLKLKEGAKIESESRWEDEWTSKLARTFKKK
ncbi:glycosyltransferase family 33 protein [[Candida] arabinofermentans NRRL YB-2248]|uniref:Chitobiosyldiphosphodolichol beta-mannosyltransferase n=1 Tax=[Candida] arabinofermentans NRRL YB-2248 TaxID=983967 RepID=A0A1E4T4E0_9ASCO|nr:glycosyltransferase family 33 protein [[Candida] arabinofermentans NRRL YB-2248]